jgi:outer membrane protein assembly factor BamB
MRRAVILAVIMTLVRGLDAGAAPWTSWAGGDSRNAVLEDVAPVNHDPNLGTSQSLNDILDASPDAALWRGSGASWSPVGACSPVVRYDETLGRHLAYVYAQGGSGFDATGGAIFAIDILSARYVWGTAVGSPQMGSWSSPTYDAVTNTILIGGGQATVVPPSGPVTSTGALTALNATTGAMAWVAPLEKTIVNATVAVGGVPGNNRIYVTDYNGFGTDGILYAVNADPNDAVLEGAIDWQTSIGGTSGATPTYHDGVVYVASINDGSGGSGWPSAKGQVYAFNAATGQKLWQVAYPYDSSVGNPFGGLSYDDGHVYVASYEFYGDHQSAALLKIDATDTGGPGTYRGGDQARIQSNSFANRTDSIPLVWERANGEKVIISSGGIQGFGTTHTVDFFDGEGGGHLLGNTALEGGDSPFGSSGEPMGWAGNWTYQPVIVNDVLYVGGPESEWFGASNHLWAIDLAALDARGWFDDPSSPFSLSVDDPAVLADLGGGSSPAYYNGMLITYGPGGLFQTYGELATDAVPEPSPLAILAIGGGLLSAVSGQRRRCRSARRTA